jgi:hypothetical protein
LKLPFKILDFFFRLSGVADSRDEFIPTISPEQAFQGKM